MEDSLGTLITIALQQGGAVIVAVFAIWMLRREYQERLKDQTERQRIGGYMHEIPEKRQFLFSAIVEAR